MVIDPQEYQENEAWLLFRLNDDPVRTMADGDFNVLAIMDVGTGLIHGMEFVPAQQNELSEMQSRRLFKMAESKTGARPHLFFVEEGKPLAKLTKVATAMGIEVVVVQGANLDPITREAREGFAAHALRKNH